MRFSQRHSIGWPIALLTAILLCAGWPITRPGWSQPPEEEPASPATGPVWTSLAIAILPKLDWDAEKRGPLLIVHPSEIWLGGPRPPEDPYKPELPPAIPLPELTDRGYNLQAVAPLFKERLVRLPTLTALAPTEMPVIPPGQIPFSPSQGHDISSILHLLLATFTEPQWRLLGSDAGIGREDLTARQYPYFDQLLPPDASLIPKSLLYLPPWEQHPLPLTPALRARLRLRCQRKFVLSTVMSGTDASVEYGFNALDREPEDPFTLYYDFRNPKLSFTQPNRLKSGEMDMDYAPFARPIPLEGLKTVGQLVQRISDTTGIELHTDVRIAPLPIVTRGEQANASDLLKGLCWSLTSTFRRLQIEGKTFFLLTFDVEPLGKQLARKATNQADAYLAANAAVGRQRRAANAAVHRLSTVRPFRFLGIRPSLLPVVQDYRGTEKWVEFAPPAAAVERLVRPDLNGDAPNVPTDGRKEKIILPVTDLPDNARQVYIEDVNEINRMMAHSQRVGLFRTDKVAITVTVRVDYDLPPYGILDRDMLFLQPYQPAPKPELRAPPNQRNSVTLSVATTNEAKRAVASARERGFNSLWLSLPDSLTEAEEKTILNAGINAAREKAARNGKPVEVVAMVSLLGRTPPEKPDGQSDLTRTGISVGEWARTRSQSAALRDMPIVRGLLAQSPDWLLPDSPAAIARVGRIVRLAETPGIAGIALKNAIPPGLMAGVSAYYRQYDGVLFSDVGYSPAFRASFARRNNLDPADLPIPSPSDLALISLPSIYMNKEAVGTVWRDSEWPSKEKPFRKWIEEREAALRPLLTRLHTSVAKARPGLPLYLPNNHGIQDTNWWGTWDHANRPPGLPDPNAPTPERINDEYGSPLPDTQARQTSRIALFALCFPLEQLAAELDYGIAERNAEWEERDAFAWFLYNYGWGRKPWDGTVLELDTYPLDTALSLLEVFPNSESTKTVPR